MYNPNNCYWIIGADEANVWSSRRAMSVPTSDPEYVEWLKSNGPSRAETIEDLKTILGEQYPPGMLETYSAYKRWVKEQAGITLTSGVPIKTDDRSQAKITGAYTAAQVNPAVVTRWSAADGSVHDMDGAAIEQMNLELLTHINNCFAIHSDVMAGIEGGTITNHAQIDAAYDAPMTQARKNWLKKKK